MKYLLIALALASCGREQAKVTCNMVSYKTSEKTFGTLEALRCDDGDVLISALPNYAPGGFITHVVVVCGQVRMECK